MPASNLTFVAQIPEIYVATEAGEKRKSTTHSRQL
jgi:hypothetical protein